LEYGAWSTRRSRATGEDFASSWVEWPGFSCRVWRAALGLLDRRRRQLLSRRPMVALSLLEDLLFG
jgi:hypothetical protein